MIDLHTHTKYSDGTDDLEEYLKKVEQIGLKYISITDHNTCRAYKELKKMDYKKLYSGKIIPGVELNTIVLSIPIEVLAYNFDIEKMQKLIDKNYLTDNERCLLEIKRLKKVCLENNISLPEDFVEMYDYSMWPSKFLHKFITKEKNNKELIDEDAWKDSNIFYRKYMSNPSTMFFINMDDILPDFEKVYSIIKEAGGLIFLPHIFEYRENSNKILKFILENYKIDGIECFYTTFSKEQEEYLLNICKERKLYISGGSDYHGKNKKGFELGIGRGNLNIDEEIIAEWK